MDWSEFYFLLVGIGFAGTGIFRWWAVSKGLLDHPKQRSSHSVPTPRGGGIIFTLGWFAFLGVFYYFNYFEYAALAPFLPTLLIVFIGIYDDFKGASRWLRLGVQILAVILSLWLLGENGDSLRAYLPFTLPDWGYLPCLVLSCVWFINLFNFMDGTDGLATVQSLVIFGLGGYAFWHAFALELAVMSWGLCALLLGFLVWNWPRAKIFMGDTGSASLGLLVCMFALMAHQNLNISLYFWVVLSSPFWFDATVTLLRRIISRDSWREPHRLHAYQRLVQSGFTHQKVLIYSMIVNGACVYIALQGLGHMHRWPLLLGVTLVLHTTLYLLIEFRKPMYGKWYSVAPQKKTKKDDDPFA